MLAVLARGDDLGLVVQILVMLVFGGICAAIASSRGRSPVGWFFIGAFFSCLGLIVLLVIPDLKKQEERDRRLSQENRRLREQIAKNRQIADSRQAGLERRLGAHDQALGLDTGETAGALTDGEPAPPPLPDEAVWFYAHNNERQGPVPEETLRHMLRERAIKGATLVWREGMPDWTAIEKLPEFRGEVA